MFSQMLRKLNAAAGSASYRNLQAIGLHSIDHAAHHPATFQHPDLKYLQLDIVLANCLSRSLDAALQCQEGNPLDELTT